MDSFSGLSWGGSGGSTQITNAKLKHMSLVDREKALAQRVSNTKSTSPSNSTSAWSGLDLLSGPSSQNASRVSTPNSGAISGTASLLDGFDDIPASVSVPATPSQVHTPPVQTQNESEYEDDLFDVFNKPVRSDSPSVNSSIPGRSPSPPVRSSRPAAPSRPTPVFADEDEEDYEGNDELDEVSLPKNDPRDRYVAELVDMGFSDVQAREALANTHNGLDVREAIDYIMSEAHRKATGQPATPVTRNLPKTSFNADADYGKMAQEIGSQLFSTASSFLNRSRKQLTKKIEMYNGHSTGDGAPAWMRSEERDAFYREQPQFSKPEGATDTERASFIEETMSGDDGVTREATLLEVDGERVRQNVYRKQQQPSASATTSTATNQKSESTRAELMARIPKAGARASQSSSPSPSLAQQFKDKLILDEDEIYAPASRRRPNAAPSAPAVSPSPGTPAPTPPAAKSKPQRAVISVSSIQMDMIQQARQSGTEAFKRGDFSGASVCYSQALQSIPPNHLLRTILLSNRSTCYYKGGDFTSAIKDATEGLETIGPSYGVGEEAEPGKPLKDIWGKLMTKKAESLEGAEKFKESLESWELLLHNGFSSPVTLAGKRRCQAALQPNPKPVSKSPSISSSVASSRASSTGPKSAAGIAAVNRVKRANAEATRTEAEKFELLETIDKRITDWKNGKEDNLRALLSSLDGILWPELGWKKVSLAELVLPKKVKIIYMKAAAKTHPDKVPATASTEQKMISQAVFITLNKAWDEFRVANNI